MALSKKHITLEPGVRLYDRLPANARFSQDGDYNRTPAQIKLSAVGDKLLNTAVRTIVTGVIVASTGLSAYHGYKRNRGSILWATVWGFFGLTVPVVTPIFGFIEGFAEPKPVKPVKASPKEAPAAPAAAPPEAEAPTS